MHYTKITQFDKIKKRIYYKFVDGIKKYLKRPTTREEWVMVTKLTLLLIAFLIVSSAAVVTLFTRASATTLGSSVTIQPVDDASVDSSSANKNFGDDNPVKVEKAKIALFKFNVESFTGRFITKAKLRVYVVNEAKKNSIELKSAMNSDWNQDKVTYNTMPPIDPAVIGMVPAGSKKGWIEIDITDALRRNTGHAWTIAMTMPVGGTDSLHMTSIDSKKNKPNIVFWRTYITIC
jgi:flagellar basal body-associated protein FliL